MTQTQPTQRRGLPSWLTITILAAAVIGGGFFVWRQFASSGIDRSAMAASLPDGVRPFNDPAYGKRGDSEFARYGSEIWAFYKLQDLDRIALHAIADRGLTNQLKLTAEQLAALQKLTWSIQLTPDERKKIDAMLADCRKAAGQGLGAVGLANSTLLDGFDEIVRSHAGEANSATAARQKQIASILKPEQIAQGQTWLQTQMGSDRWMPAVPPRPGVARSAVRNPRRQTFGEALLQWAAQPSSRPSSPAPAAPSPRSRSRN